MGSTSLETLSYLPWGLFSVNWLEIVFLIKRFCQLAGVVSLRPPS